MLQVTNNECCNQQALQVATKIGVQVCNLFDVQGATNWHYMLQETNKNVETNRHYSLTKTGLQVCNEHSNEMFAARRARCNQLVPNVAINKNLSMQTT
jgi:hypothetical protein